MLDPRDVASLAATAFGTWTLQTAGEEWAAQFVPHEPTRLFLTTIGLPVEALGLFTLEAEFETAPRALEDLLARQSTEFPGSVDSRIRDDYGGLISLGDIADSGAYLDPHDGRVLSFVNWKSAPYLLNSGVAEFVYFLAYVETHRRQDGVLLDDLPDDECYPAANRIVEHLAEVDRAAIVDPEAPEDGTAWSNWVGDGFAIALFQDWPWDGAINYFLRHGIDPTTREPRRPLPWHMSSWPKTVSESA